MKVALAGIKAARGANVVPPKALTTVMTGIDGHLHAEDQMLLSAVNASRASMRLALQDKSTVEKASKQVETLVNKTQGAYDTLQASREKLATCQKYKNKITCAPLKEVVDKANTALADAEVSLAKAKVEQDKAKELNIAANVKAQNTLSLVKALQAEVAATKPKMRAIEDKLIAAEEGLATKHAQNQVKLSSFRKMGYKAAHASSVVDHALGNLAVVEASMAAVKVCAISESSQDCKDAQVKVKVLDAEAEKKKEDEVHALEAETRAIKNAVNAKEVEIQAKTRVEAQKNEIRAASGALDDFIKKIIFEESLSGLKLTSGQDAERLRLEKAVHGSIVDSEDRMRAIAALDRFLMVLIDGEPIKDPTLANEAQKRVDDVKGVDASLMKDVKKLKRAVWKRKKAAAQVEPVPEKVQEKKDTKVADVMALLARKAKENADFLMAKGKEAAADMKKVKAEEAMQVQKKEKAAVMAKAQLEAAAKQATMQKKAADAEKKALNSEANAVIQVAAAIAAKTKANAEKQEVDFAAQ